MDLKSLLGYSQNSPFKNDKKILIKGNNITMHNTAIPLWLQGMKNGKKVGKKIKANPFDTNPYIFPDADSVEETPMFQKGGRQPILTNNPNDPRLRAYNDSLNLYKAYQFQKSNANRWPMLEEYAKNLTKMGHPTTAKELDATRQKNMGKIGKTSKLERSYNYNSFKKNPTQGYDPIDPKLGDKKIYDYYKSLKFNEPVAIGKYSSPDIIHSKIRPIGEYFDGVASSPVYKKPVQPIVYNQDIYLTPPNNKKPVQPVVYQKPLNSVFDDKSYDKKYPPKYTTNPKDPRIGMFDEAGNRWIYKKPPEPQEPVFKKPSSIQRTQTGDVNINTQRPSLKQNVELPEAFDYRKPSPFSFTYPTGPYNEQESVYFPDEKMLRSFAEGQNTTSIQSSGKGTTATGNLKQYQIGGIQDYLNSKSNSDWEVVENNFQPGGTKMNVDSILNSNKNLDWVKRLYENNPASVQLPNEKYPSTHLLEQADNRVYPRLQMVNGKLTDLGNNAYNYADSTKSYIQFANDAEALKFTQNYKSGKGVLKSFQLGGTKTDFPTPLINQKYAPGRVSDIGLRAPLPIDLNKDVEKVKENKKAANYQKLKSVGYTDKEAKALAQHTKLLPSAQDRINNLDIRNSRISKHPDYDPNKSFDEQVNLNSDNSLRTMILRGRNEFMSAKGVPILGDATKMLVSPGSSFANMTMDAENRYVKPGVKQGLMNFGLDALDVFPTATGGLVNKSVNKVKGIINNGKILKQHWLKGYKEIPKPKSNFKSDIDLGKEIKVNNDLPEEMIDLYRIQEKGAKTFSQLASEGKVHKLLNNEKTIARKAEEEKYFGQWFTKDKADLDWYARDREFTNPEIINLKVPKSKLSQYQNYDKTLSRAPEREFVIPHAEQKLYNDFKSEIDWAKWNKEIPDNPSLLNEYNTIEQTSKTNGSWMKNADGSEFQGTPEQFIQQNSSNFKKAFPEGSENVFRGTGENIAELRPNRSIFTANQELASGYAPFNKKSNFLNSESVEGGVHSFYRKNSKNSLELDANNTSWTSVDLSNKRLTKDYFERNIKSQEDQITKQKEYLSKMKQKPNGSWEAPDGTTYSNDLYKNTVGERELYLKDLKERYKNIDNLISNPKELEEMKKVLGNTTTTDDIAAYVEKRNLDYVKLKNIEDSGVGDVTIINHKPGNYLKSAVGNNGMFNMTNPNIYKALVPATAGVGVLSQQETPKKGFKNGGRIESDWEIIN